MTSFVTNARRKTGTSLTNRLCKDLKKIVRNIRNCRCPFSILSENLLMKNLILLPSEIIIFYRIRKTITFSKLVEKLSVPGVHPEALRPVPPLPGAWLPLLKASSDLVQPRNLGVSAAKRAKL